MTVIRQVSPDHPDVSRLLVQLGAHNAERHGSTDLDHSFPETWLTALVGYDGSEPVALLGIRPTDASTIHLVRLYVAPGARGQGLTLELGREALDAANRAGYAEARWDTGSDIPAVLAASSRLSADPAAPFGAHDADPRVRCFSVHLESRNQPHALPTKSP